MSEPLEAALPRDRSCARIARRILEHELGHRVSAATLHDLKLVATELVYNAFFHGRGQIVFKLLDAGDRVRVEVIDEGRGQIVRVREQTEDGSGGYGLRLVELLSDAWGAYEGTTHVWAELPAR
jgi:anti-sigma regulatory factor (Ser/Thr protein kinase)